MSKEWTRYADCKPESAGLYEWRVPSKAVPGATLIVAALMRVRGAGYENALSPEFDYWDGYRLHVQCDVQWRTTDLVLDKHRTPAVLSIEGLELSPCSSCGRVPSIEAHQRPASGGIVCLPNPWNLNSWRFICCDWGSTPSMADPRDIERIRRATRAKAAIHAPA